MAVYKRSYRGYSGPLTSRRTRFLVISRYAARGIFKSRIVTGLFILCFFFPLIMIAGLYLNHNVRVLSMIGMRTDHLMDINGQFFMVLMSSQCSMAFLLTAFIGPNMIAPDLANNALPLYFCRPLSRMEYVLGKASVILMILSCITWIPGLLVFGIETTLSGASWGWQNIRFAAGIFLGSAVWICLLAMLALALSAWVRWKLVAGALLLGVMFVSSGFAAAVNAVLRIQSASYLDPGKILTAIFGKFFNLPLDFGVSLSGGLLAYAIMCGICILLLSRKVRAFEVVK